MGLLSWLRESAEDATGLTVAPVGRIEQLEVREAMLREVTREADVFGWTALNYIAGQPQEVRPETRVQWSVRARTVWMTDPMYAAAIDLMNDFTLGRGVPKPRAKHKAVQRVLDEAWDDPDNQRVLTSYEAQVALSTDLQHQSNVFVLMFDQGDDGKVKLGLLNHDEVRDAVSDPDFRQRVLYYVARHFRSEWDFKTDQVRVDPTMTTQVKATYYTAWQVDREDKEPKEKPPRDKQGEGKVYHIRINRTSEMIFGVPSVQRTLRWFNAYNELMSARVDMAKAAAAFVMKRKIKGTAQQVTKMAQKAMSWRSDLAAADVSQSAGMPPPQRGSVLTENEAVSHEAFKIPSGSGEAAQDAEMIRAQISAATRFPQHYLGDAGSANLATATAMELPVLKAVEARQELFEGVFRWFCDRVIERANEVGLIEKYAAELGDEEEPPEKEIETPDIAARGTTTRLAAAYEDEQLDEDSTGIDTSYEFSMPSPLRRMMTDLVTAVQTIAQTFDPNNTNMELSRVLLTIVLGEGLEVEDPADVVERIFPEGYVDPAVQAAQQAALAGGGGPGGGPDQSGQDQGQNGSTPGGDQSAGADMLGGDTTYGANGGAVPAEDQAVQQALATRGRGGDDVVWLRVREGARLVDGPETTQARVEGRKRLLLDDDFVTVEQEAGNALDRMLTANGAHAEGGR